MDLENHTHFPAMLYRTALPERDGVARFAAAVIARVTYDLTDWGLVPCGEQVWPVSPAPFDGPKGPMDGDEVFIREGVDLFVFAHARTPGGRPFRRMTVGLRVNDLRYETTVTGDRTWRRVGTELVATEPEPFAVIPLTPARAFGGTGEWDGLSVPHPDNAAGRGFAIEESAAVGGPLPNVEHPSHPVRKWDDNPPPAFWTPLPIVSRERLRNGLKYDDKGRLAGIKPRFYNAAPPGLMAPALAPGDRIELAGVTESGRLAVELPPNSLKVRLRFGDNVTEQPLAIDQVGIEVDDRRVFVTFRYPFRYTMRQFRKRVCELLPR